MPFIQSPSLRQKPRCLARGFFVSRQSQRYDVGAMEHLQSVWKDAPAISRSFTVIPLVFHCASWRWSRELDVLKLSLDSFRSEDHNSCGAVVQWWYIVSCMAKVCHCDSLCSQNLQVCK